mmetsp:Transcript_15613/g.43670  ORF Transcript_15613/g.43670 Transcript_15613/m.43670 type:complete len:219 (-) Transcript_15613:30-686(-)
MELPEDTRAQLRKFQGMVEKFETALSPVLNLSPKDLEQLEPLEAAQVQMALAQAANALFKMYLMSAGTDPANSSVKKEEERLQQYSKRLAAAMNEHQLANSKRSLAVDIGAANRFIEHAIPDLSSEQKVMLRDAGKAAKKEKAEADAAALKNSLAGKKRSNPSGGSQSVDLSVRPSADAFLDSVLASSPQSAKPDSAAASPATDLKAKKKRKKKKSTP